LQGTGGGSALSFSAPKEVFDPGKLPKEVAIPAPETADGWVAWIREHPSFDAGEPSPTSVGGVSGTQLDVTVSPSAIPRDYPEEACPEPCVPGWPASGPATAYDFLAGSKVRIAVLEVEGEPVLVTAEAAEDEFEGFLPEAQQVLDTVEWASR
jgi:hypothetical protein